MTRYKFPDSLGGGEHEAASDDEGYPQVGFVLAGITNPRLWIARKDLEKVEEPLPEEPPVGSVVRAQLVDEDRLWVWERSTDHTNGVGWYAAGVNVPFEWAKLCKRETPVLLVPAPAADRSES